MRPVNTTPHAPLRTCLRWPALALVLALSACGGGSSTSTGGSTAASANQPNVVSMTPASAAAGVATTFTVSGSNLPSAAVVSLAGGSCTMPNNVTSSSFTVVCTPGPVGVGWAVATINSAAVNGYWIGQATVTISSVASPANIPQNVTSMTPQSAQSGIPTTFTVAGSNLPLTSVVSLPGGSCAAPTNVTSTGFTVVCTPGQVGLGYSVATIISAPANGYWIGQSALTITGSVPPVTGSPTVAGMTPASAQAGVPTTFLVSGTSLPSTAVAVLAGGSCAPPTNATATGFTVVCTPGQVGVGTAGVTFYNTALNGYWIGQAILAITNTATAAATPTTTVAPATTTPTVTDMTPLFPKTGLATTFTVSGTDLPPTASVSLAGGSCDAPTNVSALGFNVLCTPGPVGSAVVTIRNNTVATGGTWIGQTTLTVTADGQQPPPVPSGAPAVVSMTPYFPQTGVATNFLVTGSNLPLTSVLTLAGGICAAPTNVTAQSFNVVCTPGPVGLTNATVKNNTVAAGGYWIGLATLLITSNGLEPPPTLFGLTVVFNMTPASAATGVPTLFTVTGTNMPLTAVASLDAGSCAAPTNMTTSSFKVVCTPGPAGAVNATISNTAGAAGYLIGYPALTITP